MDPTPSFYFKKKKKSNGFILNYVCLCVGRKWECAHEARFLWRPRRVSDPLELAVVSYLMWMLGTELKSFARTVHALNC